MFDNELFVQSIPLRNICLSSDVSMFFPDECFFVTSLGIVFALLIANISVFFFLATFE